MKVLGNRGLVIDWLLLFVAELLSVECKDY